MKKVFPVITALLLTAACIAQTSGKISLSKGQQFIVNMDTKSHSVTNVMFQDMETDMNVSGTYTISVDDISGDQYQLGITLTKLKMKMNLMGQSMEYDSDKPDADSSIAEEFKGILNVPRSVFIDQSGHIIKTTSFSEEASPIIQQLGSSGAESRYAFLAVSPGMQENDSFQTNYTDTSLGTATSIKYIATSVKGDLATLSFKGISKTDKTIENFGTSFQTVSEGPVEGVTIVNLRTGVIQTTKSKIKSTGKTTGMGQEMALTAETTNEITVTESK
ncbi:MAG: hypothetical protein IT214_00650 [Chitinophagaceae bacterium]|jgi:hypothetical protein|nr:hypothetical protein [Chitinophagaceae bacterium]OQY95013.1 MAG: hypothetical protein B6D37_06990 [Sphingobacteriales bacterium UTBCD1]